MKLDLKAGFVALLGAAALVLGGGAARAAETVTYYHTDALGTPVMESNAAGVITYAREHKPYGEQALGVAKNGPGFTGHIEDTDTELTYMQARYFDSIASRFISNDPIAADLNAGANYNRYWYANNNPYKFFDPDGQRPRGTLNLCNAPGGCEAGSFGGDGRGDSGNADEAASSNRTYGLVDRLGLRGDLTKNGNIFDLEALAHDLIPPILDSPTAGGFLKLGGASFLAIKQGLRPSISVLGHYPDYVRTAESIGARYFNVPTKIWDKLTPAQQWAANTRFLDRLAARGDVIRLATPANQARAGSFFAKELQYLGARGYTLDRTGMLMLPPPR